MTKKVWTPGRKLTPNEAFAEIVAGRPVFYNHKWTHHGWARSWPIHVLYAGANAGMIREALKIKDQRNEH